MPESAYETPVARVRDICHLVDDAYAMAIRICYLGRPVGDAHFFFRSGDGIFSQLRPVVRVFRPWRFVQIVYPLYPHILATARSVRTAIIPRL